MTIIEGIHKPDEASKHTIIDEIGIIKKALQRGYETPYGALSASSDKATLTTIKAVVLKIKKKAPTLLMLVGIGGSNMGTLALAQALLGSFFNERDPVMRLYCADTIDSEYTGALLTIVEEELKKGGTVLLCIITKSGTTTETVINGSLFLELLKKYRPLEYRDHVVLITDAGSPLASVAPTQGYTLLEIPALVGGRFSVFSAVSLFPLGLLGIDTDEVCQGASAMLEICLNEDLQRNEAARTALTLFAHYHHGYDIHDLFPFSPDLVMLAQWYKQLIGESLGKKYDRHGRLVEVGIAPTVSVGTVDLHSVVQLYLAGPRTRITTFIIQEGEHKILQVPDNEYSAVIPGLPGKSVTVVKEAIFKGVLEAYKQERRPFMVVDLANNPGHNIGAFMMMKMVETLFLGRLFGIDPFDQPAVELYKEETRRLLV